VKEVDLFCLLYIRVADVTISDNIIDAVATELHTSLFLLFRTHFGLARYKIAILMVNTIMKTFIII